MQSGILYRDGRKEMPFLYPYAPLLQLFKQHSISVQSLCFMLIHDTKNLESFTQIYKNILNTEQDFFDVVVYGVQLGIFTFQQSKFFPIFFTSKV
jgi:hypothetical protein